MSDPANKPDPAAEPIPGAATAGASTASQEANGPIGNGIVGAASKIGTDDADSKMPATEAPATTPAILSESQMDDLVARLIPHAQQAAKTEVAALAADLTADLDAKIDDLAKMAESTGTAGLHAALGKLAGELATLQSKLKHWL
jgi:hypothetical protein